MHQVTLEAVTAMIRQQEDEIRTLRRRRLDAIDLLLRTGCPPKEIAEVLGVSLGLVYRRKAKIP